MTNEQAIRILRDLKECQRLRTARWNGCERNCFTCLLGHGAGEIKEALDAAIAALEGDGDDPGDEKEPCDTCEEFDCYYCEFKKHRRR